MPFLALNGLPEIRCPYAAFNTTFLKFILPLSTFPVDKCYVLHCLICHMFSQIQVRVDSLETCCTGTYPTISALTSNKDWASVCQVTIATLHEKDVLSSFKKGSSLLLFYRCV